MSTLHNRGGARPGAGRPSKGANARKRVAVMLTPDNQARLEAEAARQGVSRSELVNRLLEQLPPAPGSLHLNDTEAAPLLALIDDLDRELEQD